MSEKLDREDMEKMARKIDEIEKALLEETTYFSKERIVIAKSSLSLAKTAIEREYLKKNHPIML